MPKPINGVQVVSKFVQKHLTKESLSQYINPIIYDIPCGYGRHLQWLAKQGFEVKGFDLDTKALNFLTDWKISNGIKNIDIIREDIDYMIDFEKCDILINVHLYSQQIFNVLKNLVKPGGLLLIETPEIHGDNYLELPLSNEIKENLEQDYEIIEYTESGTPNTNPHVSVKTIARKK